MKKMKNIMLVFIALFAFFIGIDAVNAETLKEEAFFKYSTNENEEVTDAVEIKDGILIVGSKNYKFTHGVNTNEYAYMVLLSENGGVKWEKEYKIDGSKTIFWDVVPLNDYILISASSYTPNGEVADKDDYLLIYNYDGTFVKKIDVETEVRDIYGYGDYYGVSVGETGGLKVYKAADHSLVGTLGEGLDTFAYMNSEGIYLSEMSYENGITTMSLYDYSLKKVKTNTIHTSGINKDTNKYTDAFLNYRFIVTENYVYCLGVTEGYGEYTDVYTIYSLKKSDFSVIKKIEYKVGTIENIGAYKDYLVGGVLKICSGDTSCDSKKSPVVIFDSNLNIKAEREVNYQIGAILGNGIYIIGDDGITIEDTQIDVFVTKFKYDLGVEVKKVENGQVEFENIDNADGTTTIKLNITAKKGYVVKNVVVKDVNGKAIEVKDNSFVKPNSDVTVEVVFDKEVVSNPNTGLSNPFMICGVAFAGAAICYCFLKKKKYI